jgi:nicotinate-nucleotide pyrophosphorylase (carboxylating)
MTNPFDVQFGSGTELDRFIDAALAEDLGGLNGGDHTSLACIPADATSRARSLVKSEGVLAGVHFAEQVFKKVDASAKMDILLQDGAVVEPGLIAFYVHGRTQALLVAERLVLNVMQHMSGIATATQKVVKLLEGTGCQVLDTRKTTPLNRTLEKWAVRIGGGVNHRYGLFDQILVKDNHIDAAGGVSLALSRVKEYLEKNGLANMPVIVECRTLEEVEQALASHVATRILLDNMDLRLLREATHLVAGRLPTEASGGVRAETVRAIAETGVTYVSIGALTHTVSPLDISLKILHEE